LFLKKCWLFLVTEQLDCQILKSFSIAGRVKLKNKCPIDVIMLMLLINCKQYKNSNIEASFLNEGSKASSIKFEGRSSATLS
jgi:hypothetical protein